MRNRESFKKKEEEAEVGRENGIAQEMAEESKRMYEEDENSRERAVEAAKKRERDRGKRKNRTREEAKNVKTKKYHKRFVICFTFFPLEKCRQTKFLKENPKRENARGRS